MSVPRITNTKEFLEAVQELQALTKPEGVHQMYDLLTGIVAYTEDQHARKLAERIRRELSNEQGILYSAGHAANLIDPKVEK